jgi:hypothetical protein
MNKPARLLAPLALLAACNVAIAQDNAAAAAAGAPTASTAAAATAAPAAASAPSGTVAALPTLRFASDMVTAELFDPIQHTAQFKRLSKEAAGSAIELRVYHSYRINRGAALATGLLGAATLGLIPRVSNGEHAIVYEVVVNGEPVSTFRYNTEITRVQSMWSRDKTFGLGEDGLKWARGTVERFAQDAGRDPKLAALQAEFDDYFGAAAVTPAAPSATSAASASTAATAPSAPAAPSVPPAPSVPQQ